MTGTTPRVPATPYRVRSTPREGLALLDRNEGPAPGAELLEVLRAGDPQSLRRYPDARALEAALARRFGVAPSRVLVTAGADDAIDRCCRAYLAPGRLALLPTPTFEMLERYVQLTGCETVRLDWPGGAFPIEECIARLDERVGLIGLVSPNNPTGATVSAADLARLAETASDAVILLDHAYVEYADEDLTGVALRHPNVVVARTLSKAWGLAGCRVGYALGAASAVTALRSAGAPYPVAAPSLALAAARLQSGAPDVAAHVSRVRDERAALSDLLRGAGAEVEPSQANFVLTRLGRRAAFMRDALIATGVLVRDFPERPGLPGALRITLPGDPTLFERLSRALELVLRPQALLLDLDGVLADVRDSYRACVVATAASFGVRLTPADVSRAKAAGHANNDWVLTQRLLAERGVDAQLPDVTQRFQERYLGTAATEGLRARERLLVDPRDVARLADLLPLALVTGRPRSEAEWFLECAGIRACFSALVALEDAPPKPDPAPVRLALERLGVARGWMVGDTPDDVRAAAAAGTLPLGVVAPGDRGATMTAALRAAGAARVLDRLDQLTEVLT